MALFLDGLVMIGIFIFLGGVFVMLFGGRTEGGFEFTGIVGGLFIAVEIVLAMAYFIVCEARWGATPGKLAVGIRVQSVAGQRIGYGASFVRNLLRIIDILPGFYLIGAISVWITRRNQRVGDLVAGAVVVRRETGGGPRAAALAGVIAVGVGGVLLGMMLMQLGAGRQAETSGSGSGAVVPQSTTDAAASESGSMENAGATPWSSRGWVQREDDTYENPEHDLKLVVPDGWVIVDEDSLGNRILWMMAKLGQDGEQRLMMNILTAETQGMTAEEWFGGELQGVRDYTLTIGDQVQPYFEVLGAGETEQSGVYQIRLTHNPDGIRGHQLYFVRAGRGYVVTRNASADAGADEIADLELIRESMGLR
ncbi:MAG TPA: RDD family protein [Gammaproteobacteria bacterium]|nr:RDD family protein [Gammaproteobacteria bacterium]